MAEGKEHCILYPIVGTFLSSFSSNSVIRQKDFKFRFKRLSNVASLDEGYCSCCFLDFKRSFPADINEIGLKPIVCFGCLKVCHRYCYGLTTITKTQKDVDYFVCDGCRHDAKKHEACQVCGNNQGLQRQIAGFGFVHFICAITHPEVNIMDYETMKYAISPNYIKNNQKCDICHLENSYFNCAGESCKETAHPFCVLNAFKTKQIQANQRGGDPEDSWKFFISAGENKLFDVNNELIEKSWIQDETKEVFNRLDEFNVKKPDRRAILNNFHDELVRKHKPSSTIKRGGFQYTLCPTHSKHSIYCVCLMEVENTEMVLCECCLEWYHYGCGSFKGEEMYICPFCVEWYKLKDKILLEFKSGKIESYDLKVPRPPKYNIPDFLLYMLVADRRLQASFDSTGSLDKLIKTLVYFFPLKTSKISLVVRQLSERRIELIAEDFLQLYFKEQEGMLEPMPVIAPTQSNNIANIEANIQHNQTLNEYIRAAQSFLSNTAEVPFRRLAEALDWKEDLLKLKNNATESQMNSLLSTNYPHPELKYLRERREQIRLKQQIKQIQESSCTLAELENMRQAAVKLGLVAEAADLADRYHTAKSLIEKIGQYCQKGVEYEEFPEIQRMVSDLAQLKISDIVNPWDSYKKQANFVNDLFYLLTKTTKSKNEPGLFEKVNILLNLELPKASKQLKDVLKQLKQHIQFVNAQFHHLFIRFNRIAWQLDASTISKDTTTPEQLKSLFQEGQRLELGTNDENLLKVNTLYKQWQIKNEEYESFFNEQGLAKHLDDRSRLNLLFDKIQQATEFYTSFSLNTKKQVAAVSQKKVIVDFALRLLIKLSQTGIKLVVLKDLFREADIIKFPKGSQLFKRLNDLLTSSNLLQQQFIALQRKVQEKMDTFKAQEKWRKPRKQQIKSNADKPTVREAKALVEQMSASPVDFITEIETLQKYISVSDEVGMATREFMSKNTLTEYEGKEFWEIVKKQTEDLRRRILIEAPLSLNSEQADLYHYEIKSRIIMSFKGFLPSDLEKLTRLLKLADQENIQLELGDWYGRLRTEVEQGTQLQRQLDQLKKLEEQLDKQYQKPGTAPPYTSLATLRKSLNLKPLKVSSSPLILGIAQRAKKFQNKASTLRSQSKPSFEELKSTYLEGLKIPVELSALQWLAPLVERGTLLMRKWSIMTANNVDRLINEYDKLEIKIDTIENDRKIYAADSQHIDEISRWIAKQNEVRVGDFNLLEAERIEQLWESIGQSLKTTEKYESVRVKFLEFWANALRFAPPDLKLSYLKIKGLLYEMYDYLRKALSPGNQKQQTVKMLREPIEFLQKVLEKITDLVGRHNKTKQLDKLEGLPSSMDFMDITDLIYEFRHNFADKRSVTVDVRLRRPYADLNKFYHDYDRVQSVFYDEVPRIPEEKKEITVTKRPGQPLGNEEGDPRKKLKRQQSTFSTGSVTQVKSAQPVVQPAPVAPTPPPVPRDPKNVNEQDRKDIRDILYRTIRKNNEFKDINADDHAKMIENQIFGEWIQNRKKYLEVSQNFQAVFIKLQQCPLLSSKVKRKNFEFMTLKGLVDNFHQIAESEEKLQNKMKKNKEEQAQPQADIDEDADIKKEIDQIYEMKRQRQKELREKDRDRRDKHYGRDKDRPKQRDRKEKDKDRDRNEKKHTRDREKQRQKRRQKSRSRSRDKGERMQPRFSDDQDEQEPAQTNQNMLFGQPGGMTPGASSYLERQYNIRGGIQDFVQAVTPYNPMNPIRNEPVLFDPEEDLNAGGDKQKQIPKGSVIKLKDCQVDLLTQNRGKVIMQTGLYTVEDAKRLKQFCDPNLDRIVIRKDKKESEILEYLAKPSKKKYRNLVGWFEAYDSSNNQHLKELAIECETSKRVYGIQNEMVKVHIMSSRQVTKDMNLNRLVAPNKITSQSVAKFFSQRRLIFIMQFFTEKLYEVKFTMKNFPYQAVETSFEVPQYVQPVLDYYLPFDHRYSTDTSAMMTPTSLAGMPMMKVPSLMEEDYKQKVDIEGWGDVGMGMTEMPPKNAKGFSPITSEDEGEEGNAPNKKAPASSVNESKSGFDIKNFLSSLNPEAINKFIEEDTNNTSQQPSIPAQPAYIPPPPPGDMRSSSHPPSFVYQPPRIHQMPPPLVNSSTQRPVGMMPHMPVGPSMGMPQFGGIGLPPPITSNRYGPGMRPPNQLPQPYFSGGYPTGMMPHMGVPPPPSGYNMMRPQYMPPKDKKDEQNQ